ncbi:MAG: response regulator [Spirochaetaceae bacterium]|nr:MAG: response regulator [Spirochaetaceae bacterium]
MPIISMDLEGMVLSWNAAAEQVFGWSADEVLGRPLPFVPQEKMQEHMETRRRMLAGERISRLELTRRKKNGESVEISLSASAMYNETGEVIGFMAAIEDISERKQQEHDLRKAKEQAESANRAKSEFLSNLSHEIRTPLNGLLGMMQILNSSDLNEEQSEAVEAAFGSIDRLNRLLADVLNLSKIEAEKLEKLESEFSLRELCATICAEYARAAREKGLSFECPTLGPSVPERLMGDELRLRQVLYNLVGNAVKFTKRGEVRLTITPLSEETQQRWLRFSVEDTGIGVAEEHLGRLFEPFYRAEGAYSRSYQGAGLGLSLVHRFVRLMGGRVSMDSTVGSGTIVHVEVPFRVPEASAVATDLPDSHEGELQHAPLDILLVEDDRINQLALKRLLEKRGHNVEVASNGQEAVDLFAQFEFDCILMDIQMPVMNGIEATQSIRTSETLSARKRVTIFAVTAHAMAGDREQFVAAGMDDYLSKPLKLEALEELFLKHRVAAAELP